MDTTFNDPDLMWRAIDSGVLQNIGYVLIIATEAAAAVLLWIGIARLWAVRSKGDPTAATRWITYGTLGVVAVFGVGFTGVGGEWFAMWQSDTWNGLEPALRYYVFAITTLL